MDATLELMVQRSMDTALALDAADALERRRHQRDPEMSLPGAPLRRTGMAGMARAFVLHR